jgi:ABC-type multidrug transport system fused ATPase/permease subunit
MISVLKKVIYLLTPREKRQLYYLFAAMIIMAVIEVSGVSSIMPFMSVVATPDLINSNDLLNWLFTTLHFSSSNAFLLFLGVTVLVILVINNLCTALITWLIFRFTWMRNHSLSKRLLANYLQQPYVFFLNRNTADLEKNIMDEVRIVIVGIFNPLLMMVKNSVLTLFVFSLLIFIDPMLAFFVSIVIGGAYFVLFTFVNRTLNRIGVKRAEANRLRFKIASEALSGIKEIKVLGRAPYFLKNFAVHSYRLSHSHALKSVISKVPKYAFEVIAFGGILLMVLYFIAKNQDVGRTIPLLSLYAFAGYRLMPALQTIFTGASEIRYTIPALDVLYYDLKNGHSEGEGSLKNYNLLRPLPLKSSLKFNHVSYSYPDQDESVLKNLSFEIPAHSTIGLVGFTGSGKTTLIDLVLGLLEPQEGELLVDERPIKGMNLIEWQRNIGYVSQDIFLIDDTVKRNIGFGLMDDEIDDNAIRKAATIADLNDFIEGELPNGYETIVGERGVRLSGGQRQRIGIARSLYHDPEVLILDEATSALDGITEDKVMQAIHNLKHKKTIIIIAHRVSTLRKCDQIYVIEKGQISEQGSYRQLMETSDYFKEIIRLGSN